MIEINTLQHSAFSDIMRDRFVSAQAERLRARFPEQTARFDTDLSRFHGYLRSEITTAAQFGLISERDVARFLNLCVTFGPGLGRQPETAWMKAYLTDGDVPNPSDRIDRLCSEVLRRDRVSAANRVILERIGR